MRETELPPVARSVPLARPAVDAFSALTTELGRWWPRGFSGSGEALADVVLECRSGGRLYEVNRDGQELDWGHVRVCAAPTRLVLAWGLGLDGDARTEVTWQFSDEGAGSRLAFEHRGFRPGEESLRGKFDAPGGWDVILEAFRHHVAQGR